MNSPGNASFYSGKTSDYFGLDLFCLCQQFIFYGGVYKKRPIILNNKRFLNKMIDPFEGQYRICPNQ